MSPYQAPEMGGMQTPPPQKRSSIPKVMGILHIVFGAISILLAIKQLVQGDGTEEMMSTFEAQGYDVSQPSDQLNQALDSLASFTMVSTILSFLGAAALLLAGIGLVKYMRWGRTISNVYVVLSAIGKVLAIYLFLGPMSAVFDFLLQEQIQGQGMSPEALKGVMIGAMVFGVIVSSAYMIVTLILVNKKSAKESLA